MRAFLFLFLFSTLAASNYSILFIHIGKTIPPYFETAASQARLFNQDCPIILIANKKAIKKRI